ncbi:hypothetical protein K474DRAFT_1605535 [Panus rudis PR-1116 ss-1]|nr:hypothetical protein K474DRAFT_1605535 [Panus rudis PR-1116 ss-1]
MPVRTHKPTRCSNKLRLPPSPLPCIPVPAEILTPPPSPQRATSFDDAEAVIPKFPYWGYLKALNPYTPWKNWYFSREKNRYSIGTNPSMDHCMGSVIAVPDLQCIITWDGTDSPDSVQITDYAGAHNASYAAMGTYINGYRLPPHVPITLRHGDRVTLECTPVMDSEEDLRK